MKIVFLILGAFLFLICISKKPRKKKRTFPSLLFYLCFFSPPMLLPHTNLFKNPSSNPLVLIPQQTHKNKLHHIRVKIIGHIKGKRKFGHIVDMILYKIKKKRSIILSPPHIMKGKLHRFEHSSTNKMSFLLS